MLNPELWTTGLTVMSVGMGIVFTFLVILVFAILIMAKCVQFIDKVCPVVEEAPKKQAKKEASDESAVALAILAAKVKA